MTDGKRKQSFAEIVQAALDERGKTRAWLSRETGINDSMITQYLSGQSEPGLDYALQIFAVLKIDPTDYARQAGYLPPFDPRSLPEALRDAMANDVELRNARPEELIELAAWGMMQKGMPDYSRRLREMRLTPVGKVRELIERLPRSHQEECVMICEAKVVHYQKTQFSEKEETGK